MSLITLPHAVFIYDENGNPVPVVSGSTLTSGSRGFVVYGKDGSNQARNFTVDSSGNLLITGSVTVNNFPATQTITGTVGITNFPAVQSITGTVAGTGNFIVTQGTASNLNATVTGTVAVQNIDVALSTRLSNEQFTSSVGNVTANPADYTILGRLKDIVEQLSSSLNTLGQKNMSSSAPVVIASDQSRILVETTIANESGLLADIVHNGTRKALAIEYPALLWEAKIISRELKMIRKHLETITDEDFEGDI